MSTNFDLAPWSPVSDIDNPCGQPQHPLLDLSQHVQVRLGVPPSAVHSCSLSPDDGFPRLHLGGRVQFVAREGCGHVLGLCAVLDTTLRPLKERMLLPPAQMVPSVINADALTAVGLALTVAAAVAAGLGSFLWALVLWALGRALDGLDGVVARLRSSADDVGGYLDLLADTVGYAAIPLGVAAGIDTRAGWIGVAVLLGAFYLNTVSWTMLSVIIDRRAAAPSLHGTDGGAPTSFAMPHALIEGSETMLFYALFLIASSLAPMLFVVMAAAVSVNVFQRLSIARALR